MQRVGIIGCGRIAHEGHAPAYQELADRVTVVAVADPAAERRSLLGDFFKLPATARHAEYRDLLARADVDFVDICLPHHLHREASVAAAAAGKHILLEKPIAASEADALAITAAVQQAGVTFSLIHNYTRQPVNGRVLELVRAGVIGQPYLIRMESFGGYHFRGTEAYDPAWRSRAGQGGGGALLDNGYHAIYLAREAMASPVVEVFGVVGTYARPFEVEDTAVVILRHANGTITSIQQGWGADKSVPVREIQGTQGSLLLGRPGSDHPIEVWNGEQCSYPQPWPSEPSAFARLFSQWLDALEGKGPVPTPAAEGLANLRVVLAAYEASRTGRVVRLDR